MFMDEHQTNFKLSFSLFEQSKEFQMKMIISKIIKEGSSIPN